ncbi:hypothetical protein F8M41_023655 [Gigaspora margarita]|uniref:Uncharacterized protein n=1 Tax=Gigaspora margarita TaxID=4874 RepID=A0A8H4ACZ8_GIGMA|nr:hypothetical protein F8M41_023655 [Gigaspora margarita]
MTLSFAIPGLAQLVQQLRERIRTLEEELEMRQEQIVAGVENNWRREVQYERLLRDRNRLRTRVEDLEERLQEVRRNSNNNNNNNDNNYNNNNNNNGSNNCRDNNNNNNNNFSFFSIK